MAAKAKARYVYALGVLLVGGLALRLAGIRWGLPYTFNADEPHLVNLAVSFGGGSLRPYAFKYPTLWPYVLFAAYGVYFALWSGLGLKHRLGEFVGLYGWHPGHFFLIGRLLSAFFSLAGIFVLWKAERDEESRPAWPWAAALMTVSPVLVELAHSAKPDCLMFFFVCLAWVWTLRVYRQGNRRAHWLAGAFFGLAMTSQYTAILATAAFPLAHFLSRKRPSRRWLFEGCGAAAAGLLAGSPYIALDFPRFWDSMKDLKELAAMEAWSRAVVFPQVVHNLWSFSGPGGIAGLAAVVGAARSWRRDRGAAVVLAAPVLIYLAAMTNNPDGGWPRYLLGVFPALAFLASEGLAWSESWKRPILTALMAALALGPGLSRSIAMDREMRLPDTRAEAKAWILENIPPGKTLLLDLPHASPDVPMTKEELADLAERTKAAGSPRWRLFEGMARAHPGGGYRIYRIEHTARDLRSSPRHVQLSQADSPVLDVRPGLDVARAVRVDWVVTSEGGATPERMPELATFFSELERQARLEKEFAPVPGVLAGPRIRVYALRP